VNAIFRVVQGGGKAVNVLFRVVQGRREGRECVISCSPGGGKAVNHECIISCSPGGGKAVNAIFRVLVSFCTLCCVFFYFIF